MTNVQFEFEVTSAAPAPTQADPMLQPTFKEDSPHLMQSYGPMVL